jgi:hypothetical protein
MAAALEANIGPLGAILTAEQHKTLNDAAMEIGGAAYWLRETTKMTLPETVNDESSDTSFNQVFQFPHISRPMIGIHTAPRALKILYYFSTAFPSPSPGTFPAFRSSPA